MSGRDQVIRTSDTKPVAQMLSSHTRDLNSEQGRFVSSVVMPTSMFLATSSV